MYIEIHRQRQGDRDKESLPGQTAVEGGLEIDRDSNRDTKKQED